MILNLLLKNSGKILYGTFSLAQVAAAFMGFNHKNKRDKLLMIKHTIWGTLGYVRRDADRERNPLAVAKKSFMRKQRYFKQHRFKRDAFL